METQTQYRDVKTAVATAFQSTSPEQAIFRKEGEYWAIGYGRKSFSLKDTKGLGYLAHLLRHPGVEFHVLDLVGGIAGHREGDETGQLVEGLPRGNEDLEKAGIHITKLGDAGEMLDEQAKAAYRRRLSELREELEEAKQLGKPPSVGELGLLVEHLARVAQIADMDPSLFEVLFPARQAVHGLIGFIVIALACNSSCQIQHVEFGRGMTQQMGEVAEALSVL